MDREKAKELANCYTGIAEMVSSEWAKNGSSYDEVLSVAYEGLILAAHHFDPEKAHQGESGFGPYAVQQVRWFVNRSMKKEKKHSKCLSLDSENNEVYSQEDKSQSQPCDIIESRENFDRRIKLSDVKVKAPKETGKWVASLRSACFNAITEQDITEMMKAVMVRAKKGNLGAVQLILDYMCGGRGGGVNQTVIVQQGVPIE